MENQKDSNLSPEDKKFSQELDNQHLKFSTYLLAVCGRFNCRAEEAAKLIAQHLKDRS